tara:strand:- start:2 stop:217 length:216 start_codon:yes stop_codon:yes gene_type:complete
MTWEIIDEATHLLKDTDAIKIIENTVIFYVEEGISSDKKAQKELDQAWDRVKELVRKGMIAEKYMKEWGKE